MRKLVTEWRRLDLPTDDAAVVVAVSGGADSVSLLAALDELRKSGKLGLRIIAAHFNHALRGADSDDDEAFVRRLTSLLGVELVVGRAHRAPEGNVEQAARNDRYAFLLEKAEALGAFAVLTGHTINDQAETFLINLIRGSGPDGLSGMRPIRKIGHDGEGDGAAVMLVRPLLTWAKRPETEGYCAHRDITYCHDTMNEDTAFKRVRIRKILLPLLEDFNPNIVETLANTAHLLQSEPVKEPEREQPLELAIAELKGLETAELYKTIRSWLSDRRGSTRRLELKHIRAIERLAFSPKSGRTAELPGGRVVRSGGRLSYLEN